MYAYCENRATVCYDPSGGFPWTALGFAAAGAAVSVATSFVISKLMGQSYTWTDAGVAAISGAVCTLGSYGIVAAAVVNGIYSHYTTYTNGASFGKALIAGAVSMASTLTGPGNFSELKQTWTNLAAQSFIDLTFGIGSNVTSTATNLLVTPKESKKQPYITIEPAPTPKIYSRVIGPNVYTYVY